MIQKTLKEAVKRRIITANPAEDIKKPKTSQHREKVRALTVDEQYRLYKVLTTEDVQYSHQMLLSLMTGMRMGEINALRVEDINLRMKTISINKTMSKGIKGEAFVSPSAKTSNGNRTIIISDTVMPLVKEIMSLCIGREYVFIWKGKLVTTSQVNMQFQRVIEKYRILDKSVRGKVSLHSLRHAYRIEKVIEQTGARLFVLDPLQGYLSQDSDLSNAGRMRSQLKRLADIAAKHKCAVVIVGHMNKSSGEKNLYRRRESGDQPGAGRGGQTHLRDVPQGHDAAWHRQDPDRRRRPDTGRQTPMGPDHDQEHPVEREVQGRCPAAENLLRGLPDQEDENESG